MLIREDGLDVGVGGGGKVAPAAPDAPAGRRENGDGGARRGPVGTGTLATAIGYQLRARAHESAPGAARAGVHFPVAALVALVMELADNHGQTNNDP